MGAQQQSCNNALCWTDFEANKRLDKQIIFCILGILSRRVSELAFAVLSCR